MANSSRNYRIGNKGTSTTTLGYWLSEKEDSMNGTPYIPAATGIDNSDASLVGMDSDRGGEKENNDRSDETHIDNNMSQDDVSTELSTGRFEALDRKTVYNHPLNEPKTTGTSDREGRNNGDGKNSDNNAEESSEDESYKENDKNEGSIEIYENDGTAVSMFKVEEIEEKGGDREWTLQNIQKN